MIHDSCVWLAWVSRAMSGSATLSDAIAATTVASARHTTAVMIVWFELPARLRISVHLRDGVGEWAQPPTGPVRGRQ